MKRSKSLSPIYGLHRYIRKGFMSLSVSHYYDITFSIQFVYFHLSVGMIDKSLNLIFFQRSNNKRDNCPLPFFWIIIKLISIPLMMSKSSGYQVTGRVHEESN